MASAGAPRRGSLNNLHGPIQERAFDAGVLASLLHDTHIDFLEEAGDSGDDGRTDFDERLSDCVYRFDIGKRGPLKDVDVIAGAAVDMGKRKEGEREVL